MSESGATGGQGSNQGPGPGGSGGGGQGAGQGGGRRRGGLFDDLAGVAGGAFSALASMRNEAEAMVRSQIDQMVQRLDLVKREELDAAMEVARRAREQVAALEARVTALEARLATPPAEGASAADAATRPPEGLDDGG